MGRITEKGLANYVGIVVIHTNTRDESEAIGYLRHSSDTSCEEAGTSSRRLESGDRLFVQECICWYRHPTFFTVNLKGNNKGYYCLTHWGYLKKPRTS